MRGALQEWLESLKSSESQGGSRLRDLTTAIHEISGLHMVAGYQEVKFRSKYVMFSFL